MLKTSDLLISSLLASILLILSNPHIQSHADLVTSDENEEVGRFTIEGRVYPPQLVGIDSDWQKDTTVSMNRGEYKGFVREDGSFTIMGVPSGSYILEVHDPDFYYEPVRVEINPKGKFRARKVNFVQPGQILQVPYPLRMKAIMKYKYFQTREQWKITDFLFSPMVLMMLLPLLLMLILPKMMSDAETKKEMENINFPKMTNEMPEISEMLTSFFTGTSSKDKEKQKPAAKSSKSKRN